MKLQSRRWGSVLASVLVLGLGATGLLAACGGSTEGAALPESPNAEIPIRRVVLYQNGVGYFERSGRVEGNVLSIQIRPSQINDLLKSLTVIDTSKGRAVSISLPLEKSGDRVLSELPDQVRNAGGLLDVLQVFRGAKISVSGEEGSASGRVVGVENLPAQEDEKVVTNWRVTLRTDEGTLRVYPLAAITEVQIEDRALAVGLDQSLSVSLNEGNWKPIQLAIRLAGSDAHDLQASYIVEMPRWKPAYRLVLSKNAPLLQGWAVVDNVSGEDWNNVELSLVAGTPVSFVYDLHSPQYTHREDLTPRGRTAAPVPLQESAGVVVNDSPEELVTEEQSREMEYDRSMAPSPAAPPMASRRGAGGPRMASKSVSANAASGEGYDASFNDDQRLEEQGGPQTAVEQMGALFRYDIRDKVTVPDRSSTLVSIVNQRVDAEEVVYFRPDSDTSASGGHPYRAAKLTNNTPFTLEKGPVALYADGTFSGEGFIDRVEPGSTHFVTYAIDNKVALSSDYSTDEESAQLIRIVDGQLVSEFLSIQRTTYQLNNLHSDPVRAYIRTDKRAGWTLKNRPEKTVETTDALLVPVTVPAKGKAALAVEWTSKMVRNVSIDSSDSTTLLKVYLKGGNIPAAAKQAIEQVLALKAQLSEIETEAARLRKQHDALSRDQDRVRANLDTLRKTKGNDALQAELARKLAEQEAQLGKLSGGLVALSEKEAELTSRLKVLISNVSLQ